MAPLFGACCAPKASPSKDPDQSAPSARSAAASVENTGQTRGDTAAGPPKKRRAKFTDDVKTEDAPRKNMRRQGTGNPEKGDDSNKIIELDPEKDVQGWTQDEAVGEARQRRDESSIAEKLRQQLRSSLEFRISFLYEALFGGRWEAPNDQMHDFVLKVADAQEERDDPAKLTLLEGIDKEMSIEDSLQLRDHNKDGKFLVDEEELSFLSASEDTGHARALALHDDVVANMPDE